MSNMTENTKDKFFVIVRLFPGWESQMSTIEECSNVYRSMRVEVQQMDQVLRGREFDPEDTDINYVIWESLHKAVDFDSPFEILIKKNLTRLEMMDLVDKLHNPITPDMSESGEQSYEVWMTAFQDALGELEQLKLR